jgi:hypothetical protein
MHASHIQRFLVVAEEYPDGYWYSDQVSKCTPLYDHAGIEEDANDEPEQADEPERPPYAIPVEHTPQLQGLYGLRTGDWVVYTYMHKVNGCVTIKTRADAMGAANQAADADDPRAISWTMLALLLPK